MKRALSSLRKSVETESPLKMLENAFYLKYSSRSHDIKIFVLNFRSCRNTTQRFRYTKCDGDTIPRSFSKKSKLSISLDQYSEVLYSLLL